MPLKPKRFVTTREIDDLAMQWLGLEADELSLAGEKKKLKKQILAAIRAGHSGPGSKAMKVLIGAALELQGIFPVETIVDPVQAREFMRQYRTLGLLLFERCERFALRPGSFEANEIRLD